MGTASQFLKDMFGARSKALVCIASYANEGKSFKPAEIYTRDPGEIERFLKRYDKPGRAVYFSVNTIVDGKTRSKENVAEITALHADLDFKGIVEGRREIEAVLARLPLKASRIVFSGHGLHVYWWTSAPPELKDRVEATLKRLCWALAGDVAVCEVARVMRLPGSHNSKFDEWRRVVVVHKNDVVYELDDLEAWLAGVVAPLLQRKGGKGNGSMPPGDDPFAATAKDQISSGPIDVEQILAEMQYHGADGNSINLTQWRAVGSLLFDGVPVDEVIDYIVAETWRLIPESVNWSQTEEINTIRDMCGRTLRSHPEYLEKQLVRPKWLERWVGPQIKIDLGYITGEDLEKLEVEDVQWIVPHFIMKDVLNGMFGDGGTGKDYLLLQLAIAVACGNKWLGRKVTPGKVLYFNVEDRIPRIRWRQKQITNHLQTACARYPDRLRVVPLVGKNTIIASFDSRSGLVRPTPIMATVRNMIEAYHPDLVIMGNRVNIFAVNQNEDSHARQCIELLNAISLDYSTTVIMPGHVSVRSLDDESGTSATGSSGSVQWSNGPRHRLLLSKAKKEKDAVLDESETYKRTLKVIKSNDAPSDVVVELKWSKEKCLYVADDEDISVAPALQLSPDELKKDTEREFLRMLDKHTAKKENVSASATARNNAPMLFSKDPDCKYRRDKGKRLLRDAMDRLFAGGSIRSVDIGPPSNPRPRLERVKLHIVKDTSTDG